MVRVRLNILLDRAFPIVVIFCVSYAGTWATSKDAIRQDVFDVAVATVDSFPCEGQSAKADAPVLGSVTGCTATGGVKFTEEMPGLEDLGPFWRFFPPHVEGSALLIKAELYDDDSDSWDDNDEGMGVRTRIVPAPNLRIGDWNPGPLAERIPYSKTRLKLQPSGNDYSVAKHCVYEREGAIDDPDDDDLRVCFWVGSKE